MNINEKLKSEDGTEKAYSRAFKSLVGGLIYLCHTHSDILALGIIEWSLKKQLVTTFSSFEVEYVTATSSTCEAIWLRRLLADMSQEQTNATGIFCDKKSTSQKTHHYMEEQSTSTFVSEIIEDGFLEGPKKKKKTSVNDTKTKLNAKAMHTLLCSLNEGVSKQVSTCKSANDI
ncbi:hypothetical protein GQ457_09G020770 [Hibiscus cannabinus]